MLEEKLAETNSIATLNILEIDPNNKGSELAVVVKSVEVVEDEIYGKNFLVLAGWLTYFWVCSYYIIFA